MTPITAWHRWDLMKGWRHNHIEDGHAERLVCPKPPAGQNWKPGAWSGAHAWLTDDVPPKVVYYSPEET